MEERQGFRWTERRAARLIAVLLSGAVVLADIYLLLMVSRMPSETMAGWKVGVLAGVAAIFLFASFRFRRHLRLFLRDE